MSTTIREKAKVTHTELANHRCRIGTNCITAVMGRINSQIKERDILGSKKNFSGHRDIFFKTGRSREKRDEWKIYVRIPKYNIHRPQGEVVFLRFSSRCVRYNNARNKLPSKQPVIVNLIWQHVST